jgi:putative ABC transport system substrate-binding protein
MNRNFTTGFVLSALLFALCGSATAQQPAKIPRIGYLSGSNPDNDRLGIKAFRQGLQEVGYIEGKNILVEYRYQEGNVERGPILVSELVKLKVDVLVVIPSSAILAAKQATQTIQVQIANVFQYAVGSRR